MYDGLKIVHGHQLKHTKLYYSLRERECWARRMPYTPSSLQEMSKIYKKKVPHSESYRTLSLIKFGLMKNDFKDKAYSRQAFTYPINKLPISSEVKRKEGGISIAFKRWKVWQCTELREINLRHVSPNVIKFSRNDRMIENYKELIKNIWFLYKDFGLKDGRILHRLDLFHSGI